QVAVNYPIDMTESSFSCSDKRLETVYEFCKYSILATSFAGIYVDGDRERIPYEADAYINMMSHYAISSDTALARFSHEYLMDHPTWPTEWKQHSVMMAWTDWMQTGDLSSAARCYDRLKKDKLLLDRAREDGLLTSLNYLEGRRKRNDDIIDWPPRDRDGYVFTHVSCVINAFHYLNLRQMAELAAALGKADDAAFFTARAEKVQAAFQRVFFNPATGRYRDGEGTDHETLHGNAAALAFGLVPEARRRAIGDYLADRGMVCSVYFAQYYLEALYAGGRADAAYARLAAEDDRSWLGMLKQGTTITLECWNMPDKPNLDWNHAWGTPALNVLSRYVLGVTPAAPGWTKVRIAPQLGPLERVSGVVPTPRGSIRVTHTRQADGTVKSDVILPPGMTRE
ncbi:MAG: alpha-L-rhamnosidase, partial [Kiritimatiellae bacterium]|nr:alpha-L-rhamnosidase [Kiritimatiellia bacterium]